MILVMTLFRRTDAKTAFQLLSYTPSTGTYYSPQFVADTSPLQSKGLWLHHNGLATKTVMQMLPSLALQIRKSNGMPDEGGQLWTFTDVYHVNVCYTIIPILTMYALLTGVHVPDKNICIPPDIFIGICNTAVKGNESKQEANKWLKNLFVKNCCNQIAIEQVPSVLYLDLPLLILKNIWRIPWLSIVS